MRHKLFRRADLQLRQKFGFRCAVPLAACSLCFRNAAMPAVQPFDAPCRVQPTANIDPHESPPTKHQRLITIHYSLATDMRRTIEIAILLSALLIATLAAHAWFAARADQQRLQSALASEKQLLDAADSRERARAATLNDTLAQIDALKRATQTPTQIVRDLPQYLSLPQPITLASPASPADTTTQQGTGRSEKPASVPTAATPLPGAPSAQLPAADLKPLYNYVQDCRACQAQLAAARLNSADDATKIAALTHERDAAITAAKGGGLWLRLRLNALWFVVGAASGYAAKR
jgi:hypothetical protein